MILRGRSKRVPGAARTRCRSQESPGGTKAIGTRRRAFELVLLLQRASGASLRHVSSVAYGPRMQPNGSRDVCIHPATAIGLVVLGGWVIALYPLSPRNELWP